MTRRCRGSSAPRALGHDAGVGTVSWEIDDRPLSRWTRAYVWGMRLRRDKQAFAGVRHTRARAEQLQRKGDHPPTVLTRWLTDVSTTTVADLTVWVVRPRGRAPSARVVYLHGGGYVHPLTADYWRLIRTLARGGAEVLVPAYPLAPGATVDDVLPALVEVVRRGAAGGRSLPVVLMGDSAGGALALSMAGLVQDLVPPVASIVCLCPWLDATLDQDEVPDLEPSDPMLAESGLRAAGRWWSGMRSASDPLVSPMRARLDDLPPIDLYVADRDILRPAVDRMVARAASQRVEIAVHEFPRLFHVWMTRRIPEGRRTRRALARCVQQRVEEHHTR